MICSPTIKSSLQYVLLCPLFFFTLLSVPLSLSLSLCSQFEYQQAQLEAEIENLSWKVERADSYERAVGEGELSANDRGVRE